VLALVFVGTKLFGNRDSSHNQAKNSGGVSASASGSASGSASNCGDYQIVAPAEVASIVTETVGPKLGCHNVKVTTASSLAFLEQSSAGTVHPDAWITGRSVAVGLQRASRRRHRPRGRVRRPGFASTPVVLAVPASLANADTTGPHNWIDALAKLQLSAAAPGEYAPAALAFTAVWQMFANLPGGEQAVSEPFFEIVRAQVPVAASFERSSNTSTARAFPTTEQQIRAWNTAHTAAPISAMTPNEGAPMMNYTLVRFDQSTTDADAFSALETALTTDAATKAFTAAGFRSADGKVAAELVPGVPVVLPGTAPQIGTKTLVRLLSDMQWITRKVSILNVVDVSGSMVEKSGDQTRIERAIDAVNETTSRIPDNARAGLWVFSSDRRPGGRDYEQLVATLGVRQGFGQPARRADPGRQLDRHADARRHGPLRHDRGRLRVRPQELHRQHPEPRDCARSAASPCRCTASRRAPATPKTS